LAALLFDLIIPPKENSTSLIDTSSGFTFLQDERQSIKVRVSSAAMFFILDIFF
jgi:hypothetical protein